MPSRYSVYVITRKPTKQNHKSRYYPVVQDLDTGERTYYQSYTVKRDAEAHRDRLKNEIATDQYSVEDYIFAEWYETWLATKYMEWKPSTYNSVEHSFRNHILPFFKNKHLSEITPTVIQAWVNKAAKSNAKPTVKGKAKNEKTNQLSPGTVQRLYRYLRACLKHALAQGLMKKDPFQRIVLPRVDPSDPPFLDEDEILQLLEVGEKPEVDLFAVLAYTGMRFGEGLGLAWKHIKFAENIIRVERTYSYGSGMGPPKTPTSRRSIPMLPLLSERLQDLYLEQCKPKPEALLFSLDLEKRNEPLDPSNVRRDFNKAREKAGLKKVDMKSLRHSFVSIMLDSGATLAVISRCVGHADIATTARVYSHLIKEDLGEAGIKADQRFRNGRKTGDVMPFTPREASE